MQSPNPILYELGEPIAKYRSPTVAQLWIAGVLLMLVALIGCGVVVSSPQPGADQVLWVIGGLFVGGGGLIGCWYYLRDLRVLVFEQGLAYQRGGRTTVIRWEDITAIWQKHTDVHVQLIPAGTLHSYRIQTVHHGQFKFGSLISDVEQLGTHIHQQVMQRLAPQMIAAFRGGQRLSFGIVDLSLQGIHNGKKLLSWHEATVQVAEGMVNIKKRGAWVPWYRVAVGDVPNYAVFMMIIDEQVKGQARNT